MRPQSDESIKEQQNFLSRTYDFVYKMIALGHQFNFQFHANVTSSTEKMYRILRYIQLGCKPEPCFYYDYDTILEWSAPGLLQNVPDRPVEPPNLQPGFTTLYCPNWSLSQVIEVAERQSILDPLCVSTDLESLCGEKYVTPVAPGYYSLELPAVCIPGKDVSSMTVDYALFCGNGGTHPIPIAVISLAILLHILEDNGRAMKTTEFFIGPDVDYSDKVLVPGIRNGKLSFRLIDPTKTGDKDLSLAVLKNIPVAMPSM